MKKTAGCGTLILVAAIGLFAMGFIGAMMNPDLVDEVVEEVEEKKKKDQDRREFLKNFVLTQSEKLSALRTIEENVQRAFQNQADIGVIVLERIDKLPNGDTCRYVVDKRIRVPDKVLKAKLRAMVVVSYDGTDRTVNLDFVNVDGESVGGGTN